MSPHQHKAILKIIEDNPDKQKNLTEMTLKIGEEFGELAQKVLPFVGAGGTKYKGAPTEEEIVEEAIDVILAAWAVVYQFDMVDDAIDNMIDLKIKKWKNNLEKENK